MCHIILLLPFLALPVFWVWPLSVSGPVYSIVLGLSVWIYVATVRAMRRPPVTGLGGLLDEPAVVVEKESRKGLFQIQTHSEIWQAESSDALSVGDVVKIEGINGLKLKVCKLSDDDGGPTAISALRRPDAQSPNDASKQKQGRRPL